MVCLCGAEQAVTSADPNQSLVIMIGEYIGTAALATALNQIRNSSCSREDKEAAAAIARSRPLPAPLRLLHGLAPPGLRTNERLVRSGWAAWIKGLIPSSGYLWLTNQRLIYKSSRLNFPGWRRRQSFEVELRQIETVGKKKRFSAFLGGFSLFLPVFTVCVKQGQILVLQTYQVNAWRHEIVEQVKGLPERSPESPEEHNR